MRFAAFAFLAVALLLSGRALADVDALPVQQLSIKNHVFTPKDFTVPTNTKIKLVITNEDATSAEFESSDLNREKVVPANKQVTVFIDPLMAGTYTFYDDFHRATTTGTITASGPAQ